MQRWFNSVYRCIQEIDVPKGDFLLRTRIYDAGTGKVGTLGIPLMLVDSQAATKQATAK
jgi:hypothetical protein